MEEIIEQVKQTTKDVMSELQSRSQESTGTSGNHNMKNHDGNLDNRERDSHIKNLGGLRAYETFTEEAFKGGGKAFDFVKTFDHRKHNLFLYGPAGTGKSHLATIAARRKINAALTTKPYNISRDVRAAEDAFYEEEVIGVIKSSPLLLIDDFAIVRSTEFLVGILYEIIDWRYMNLPGGLIITSNLSLDDLADNMRNDRIPSRLAQMCSIFEVKGDDKRLVAAA